MKKQPNQICRECGITANVLTCLKKYGKPPKELAFTVSTWNESECEVCGEKKWVTESRDFYHPNWELMEKYFK